MENCVDRDQLASEEASWSGSTLFAKAGYIWVQQDKGYEVPHWGPCSEYSQHMFSSLNKKQHQCLLIEKSYVGYCEKWQKLGNTVHCWESLPNIP